MKNFYVVTVWQMWKQGALIATVILKQ